MADFKLAQQLGVIDSEFIAVDPSLIAILQSFGYRTALAPTDAGCVSSFARTFQHQDWVDGESVVQAGKTTGEDGFNDRFHKIEHDLDAIKADLSRAFACLAEIRKTAASCFTDILNELRKLEAQIRPATSGSVGGVHVPSLQFESPFPIDKTIGMDAFLGQAEILGNPVTLWKSESGGILAVPGLPASAESWQQPALQKAGAILQIEAEHPEIQQAFRTSFTAGELVRQFGDLSAQGMTLRQMAASVPPTTSFKTVEAFAKAVAQREGASLRTNAAKGATLLSAIGVDAESGSAASASVTRLPVVGADAQKALASAKVKTVSQLAKADRSKLTEALAAAGVQNAASEAARLSGLANTLIGIG